MNGTRIEVSDGLAGAGGRPGIVLEGSRDIEGLLVDAASFGKGIWRKKDGRMTRLARRYASSWECWKSSSLGNAERNATYVVSLSMKVVPDWTGKTVSEVSALVWAHLVQQQEARATLVAQAEAGNASARFTLAHRAHWTPERKAAWLAEYAAGVAR